MAQALLTVLLTRHRQEWRCHRNLAANLEGAKRVDLSLCDGHGAEQLRLRDIPVHSAATSVVYQESINFAKALPTTTIVARLVTVDQTGSEHLLGEYTFNHTRSLPGPDAWPPA